MAAKNSAGRGVSAVPDRYRPAQNEDLVGSSLPFGRPDQLEPGAIDRIRQNVQNVRAGLREYLGELKRIERAGTLSRGDRLAEQSRVRDQRDFWQQQAKDYERTALGADFRQVAKDLSNAYRWFTRSRLNNPTGQA